MKTRICAATLAATLAATALDATAMLPSTGAGFLDPTFGNNGAQTLAVRNGYEGAYELVALPTAAGSSRAAPSPSGRKTACTGSRGCSPMAGSILRSARTAWSPTTGT